MFVCFPSRRQAGRECCFPNGYAGASRPQSPAAPDTACNSEAASRSEPRATIYAMPHGRERNYRNRSHRTVATDRPREGFILPHRVQPSQGAASSSQYLRIIHVLAAEALAGITARRHRCSGSVPRLGYWSRIGSPCLGRADGTPAHVSCKLMKISEWWRRRELNSSSTLRDWRSTGFVKSDKNDRIAQNA